MNFTNSQLHLSFMFSFMSSSASELRIRYHLIVYSASFTDETNWNYSTNLSLIRARWRCPISFALWPRKRMRHRGFWPWGIQTGLFTACVNDFVPKKFQLCTQPPIINHFFIMGRGRKEEIGESSSALKESKQTANCGAKGLWSLRSKEDGASKVLIGRH